MRSLLVCVLLLAVVSSFPTSKLLQNAQLAQKKELNMNKGSRLGLFDKLNSPLIKARQLLTDTESSTSGSDTESETGSDTSSSSTGDSTESTNSTDSSSGSSTDSSTSGSDSTSTDSTSTDSTSSDSTDSTSTDSSSSSSSWNDTSSDSSSEDSTSEDSTSEDSSSGTGSSSDSSDGSTSSPLSMSTSSSSSTGGSCCCDNSQVELGEGWVILEESLDGVYVYDSASGTFIREDGAYSIWINTVGQLTVGDSTSSFMFLSYIATIDEWTDDNNPAVNSNDETNWEAGHEMVTFETGVIASYCDGEDLGTALCSDDGTSLFPDWYSCEETDGGSYTPATGASSATINSWNVAGLMVLIAAVMKMF